MHQKKLKGCGLMNLSKEELEIWQPVTSLKGEYIHSFNFFCSHTAQ